MERQVEEFVRWLLSAKEASLPKFENLPRIPLFMEQVVAYVNDALKDIAGKEKVLTPFMVNNYVKAKIIKEPDGKKYHEEHLGYLMFICMLKDCLSMEEIMTLIDLDVGISTDKSKLYKFFSNMSSEMGEEAADRLLARLYDFYDRYEKNKEEYGEKAEEDLRNSMGLVALRLAVRASLCQRLAKRLLAAIGEDLYGEEYTEMKYPSKKEGKKREKAASKEAERVASAKKQKDEAAPKKEKKAPKEKKTPKREPDIKEEEE